MIPSEDRGAIVALLQEGISHGVSAKAIADLFGVATRTLRRWGLMIRAQGFSLDQRKGASRHVMHRFTEEERQQEYERQRLEAQRRTEEMQARRQAMDSESEARQRAARDAQTIQALENERINARRQQEQEALLRQQQAQQDAQRRQLQQQLYEEQRRRAIQGY